MTYPLHRTLQAVRAKRGELLLDMAKKIGVSASELSEMEHGKKEVPLDIAKRLMLYYPEYAQSTNRIIGDVTIVYYNWLTQMGAFHIDQATRETLHGEFNDRDVNSIKYILLNRDTWAGQKLETLHTESDIAEFLRDHGLELHN